MPLNNLKSIVPIGLLFPFLLILVIEYGIIIGLESYNNSLERKKSDLEKKILTIKTQSGEEINKRPEFNFFSRVVNIEILLKERKLIKDVINSFNKIIPIFVDIKSFDYDADNQKISFQASVSNWRDYVRFYKYIYNQPKIKVESLSLPSGDESIGKINFSVSILLNKSFFE